MLATSTDALPLYTRSIKDFVYILAASSFEIIGKYKYAYPDAFVLMIFFDNNLLSIAWIVALGHGVWLRAFMMSLTVIGDLSHMTWRINHSESDILTSFCWYVVLSSSKIITYHWRYSIIYKISLQCLFLNQESNHTPHAKVWYKGKRFLWWDPFNCFQYKVSNNRQKQSNHNK